MRNNLAALSLFAALLSMPGCHSPSASPAVAASRPALAPALFRDVAVRAGIDFRLGHGGRSPLTILETLGHGCAFLDYDGDGWPDILLLGPNRVALYHNERNGTFRDATAHSGLKQEGCWQGVACGDFDNDGRVDLFLTGYRRCALYRNEGGGRFTNVTAGSGINASRWSTSAAFVDVDNDGRLDLVVAHYVRFLPTSVQFCNFQGVLSTCGPTTYDPDRPSLYHNIGGGQFVDETVQRGLGSAHGNALGIAIADYDGDGWPDIAIANDQLPGDLFHNTGGGRFENVGGASGTAYDANGTAHAGMGIDWADFDRCGKLELFVTTYQHQPKSLYKETAPGLFSDISSSAGTAQPTLNFVGFGTKFFDYDNDGQPDLVIANGHAVDTIANTDKTTTYAQPLQLFHNEGEGRLAEVSGLAGPDFRRAIVGRGLAVADYDHDGRPDILVSDTEGMSLLLHNESPAGNWISLRLIGRRANRDGIGARIFVTINGVTTQFAAGPGGSFMSSSDPSVHIGLGSSAKAERMVIHWPGGGRTVLKNLSADRPLITVDQQRGLVEARR